MTLVDLCFVAFCVNAAVDSGRGDGVTVETILAEIRDGRIIEFLETRDIDLGLLNAGARRDVAKALKEVANCGDARWVRRKFGVRNRGLCVLIGFLAEIIQRRRAYDFGVVPTSAIRIGSAS